MSYFIQFSWAFAQQLCNFPWHFPIHSFVYSHFSHDFHDPFVRLARLIHFEAIAYNSTTQPILYLFACFNLLIPTLPFPSPLFCSHLSIYIVCYCAVGCFRCPSLQFVYLIIILYILLVINKWPFWQNSSFSYLTANIARTTRTLQILAWHKNNLLTTGFVRDADDQII